MRSSQVVTILAQLAAVVAVQTARADFGTYYTREDTTRCSNQTENAAIGGGVGLGVGALAGAALNSASRGAGAVVGGTLGLVTGGLLGLGLSCEEETQYVKHVDESLGDYRYRYWEPIERENYRIIVLERGKNWRGDSCSFYQVEFFGVNNRPQAVRETACRMDGAWRHFRYFPGDPPIIRYRSYFNPRPEVRVVWAPPHRAYSQHIHRPRVEMGPREPYEGYPQSDYRPVYDQSAGDQEFRGPGRPVLQ